jgi:hypothetical protein
MYKLSFFLFIDCCYLYLVHSHHYFTRTHLQGHRISSISLLVALRQHHVCSLVQTLPRCQIQIPLDPSRTKDNLAVEGCGSVLER